MKQGKVEVICGNGVGKTSLAVGKGIVALTKQKDVIMIQFLKGSPNQEGLDILKCMEPQTKKQEAKKQQSRRAIMSK